MDEKRAAFIQQLRKLRHGLNQSFVDLALRMVAIGNWQPDPVDACLFRHIAVMLGVFFFFQQGHNVRTSHLTQAGKIHFARTVVKGNAAIAHFYEVVL